MRRNIIRSQLIAAILILCTYGLTAQDWHPSVELVSTGNDCDLPVIAAFDNFVHVTWMDYRNTSAFPEIYYKRSSDFGLTWEPGKKLSNMPAGSGPAYPKIATRDNFVHIVWAQYNTIDQVYYCRSTDAGGSFTIPIALTAPPSHIYDPDIAVFEDHVHIVYRDDRASPLQAIYYLRSDDNGNTWTPEKLLTVDGQKAYKPKIAVSGPHVFVSWNEQTNNPSEMFFMRSLDNGENWESPLLLSNTGIIQSQHDLALPNDHDIHVVWEDKRDGQREIYHKVSHDAGENWEPELRLTFSTLWSSDPSISAVADKVCLTYTLMESGEHIQFLESLNGGMDWTAPVLLDEHTGLAVSASISSFNEDIFVVWTEGTSVYLKDVYFRRRIDHSSIDDLISIEHDQPILYQNYPNPADGMITFDFYLPRACEAWIAILDTEGKNVASLGKASYRSGFNKMLYNTDDLLPGTYIYRLYTIPEHRPGNDLSRKMIVR